MQRDNPFIDEIEAQERRITIIRQTDYWRSYFRRSYDLEKRAIWPFKFLGRGWWSHTVTREQHRRFRKCPDPLMAYPDEIFAGWVCNFWDGVMPSDKPIFDEYVVFLRQAP